MFDISFAELMMIAVVALIVIGPDKLPHVARTVGAFVGRLQRYVAQVKEEVNREVRFEELQSLQQEIKQGAGQVESSIMEGTKEVRENLASLKEEVKPKSKTARTSQSTAKKTKKSTGAKKAINKTSAKQRVDKT